MAKPGSLPRWANVGGAIVDPPSGKKDIGWIDAELPPHTYFNWFMNLVYLWTVYLDGLTGEALTWTAAHIFQAGITVTNSTSNGAAVTATGNGTGAGVTATGGGTNGTGVSGTGGATNGKGVNGQGTGTGSGVEGTGGASNAIGVKGTGTGTAAGVSGTGGGTNGAGVSGTGGASSGAAGVSGTGGSTNGKGVSGAGVGSGSGGDFTGGASAGKGVNATGGAGGVAVYGQGGSSAAGGEFYGGTNAPGIKAGGSSGNHNAFQVNSGWEIGFEAPETRKKSISCLEFQGVDSTRAYALSNASFPRIYRTSTASTKAWACFELPVTAVITAISLCGFHDNTSPVSTTVNVRVNKQENTTDTNNTPADVLNASPFAVTTNGGGNFVSALTLSSTASDKTCNSAGAKFLIEIEFASGGEFGSSEHFVSGVIITYQYTQITR